MAEKDCTTSLLLDPTNVKVLLNRSLARKVGVSGMNLNDWLALFLQRLSRYKDALKDMDALLKLDPSNPEAIRERELLNQLQVGMAMGVVTMFYKCLQEKDEGHATVDL